MSRARMLVGDVFDRLAGLPDGSIDLVLTSPPFLALRSYLPPGHVDKGKEIGSEATPAEYLNVLLALTAEWRRVLAPHGSIVVELGDTYSGARGYGTPEDAIYGERHEELWAVGKPSRRFKKADDGWPLSKSLACIPALYEASLAYGRNLLTGEESPAGMWRVRNLVCWARPNPPVGALGDKVRPSTSYIVWACTARDRWFDLDAVRTPPSTNLPSANGNNTKGSDEQSFRFAERINNNPAGAPPLDHWVIPPGGFSGAHYAVWPAELLTIPIQASCPRRVCRTCGQPSRRITEKSRPVDPDDSQRVKHVNGQRPHGGRQDRPPEVGWEVETTTTGWTSCGCPDTDGLRLDGFHSGIGWRPGVVLDPFVGSGTTLVVATGHGRDAIGIDLDARNVDLARERLGMFLEVDDAPVADVGTGDML